MPTKKAVFKNEADLCLTFIKQLPPNWTAYPETCGFDIVLVRTEDGAQLGIEAKMTLNAKVILQSIEGINAKRGPDFRACLVPYGTAGAEMSSLARKLGVTVIEMKTKEIYLEMKATGRYYGNNAKKFEPDLPIVAEYEWRRNWVDLAPADRCILPEYVPDVRAGASGPSQLSDWKIKAIKICILLEKRGFVVSMDFVTIKIDRRRFLDMGWIVPDPAKRGRYLTAGLEKQFRRQHPVNYGQIEADFEKWKTPESIEPAVNGMLL